MRGAPRAASASPSDRAMARSARREGFSRRHRYDAPGSFAPVLRGSRKLRGRFAVLHVTAARGRSSRLGVALTRRLVARAVDRNRLKRIAREIFRRHPAKHAGLDCVIALRTRIDRADEAAAAAEIRAFLDQLAQ